VKVDNVGKAIIGFNRDLKIVPNLSMINNGTIYFDQVDYSRRLQADNSTDRIPILQVNVIPGIESDGGNLNYTWNVTQQGTREIKIQLYFSSPSMISTEPVSVACLTSLDSRHARGRLQ